MPTEIQVLSHDSLAFPPVHRALRDPDGLLAAGGDLSVPRLLRAYSLGIFPWYEDGQPILWWSPDPRCILRTESYRPSRSLRKTLNKGLFRVTTDQAFNDVMLGCAAPRAYTDGTWITDDMHTAYLRLHHHGYAHSVECWNHDNMLVGGLYGVCIGKVFFGESMFSKATNASKVAFATLAFHLHDIGIPLLDCQVTNEHLLSLGAEEILREDFIAALQQLIPTWEDDNKPPSAWMPLQSK